MKNSFVCSIAQADRFDSFGSNLETSAYEGERTVGFLRVLETIRTPFWDTVFQFLTLFGEETMFMIAAMIIFWCINKRSGYFLLYVCILGGTINQFLKLIFCVPRPWILDDQFTIVESAREGATGYSFPSGHTQSAGGLFLGIGRLTHNLAARIACVTLVLLVAFSRMYLGVHTPADVLVSLGIATLLVMGASPLFHRAWTRSWKWHLPLVGALLGVGAALLVYAECFPLPAGAILTYSQDGLQTAYKMFGASIGYAVVLYLDTRFIRFDTKAVWWAQVLKVVVGLALVIAIRMLLKSPLLALTGGHALADGLRYFLMMLFGGVLWPLTFKFFGRLGKTPEAQPQAA